MIPPPPVTPASIFVDSNDRRAGRQIDSAAGRDRLRPPAERARVLPDAGVHPPDDRDGPRGRIGHHPARLRDRPHAGRGRRDRRGASRTSGVHRPRPPRRPPARARAPSPLPAPAAAGRRRAGAHARRADEHPFAVGPRRTAIAARAKRGTRVRYSLSEPATVTFAIARARPGPPRRGALPPADAGATAPAALHALREGRDGRSRAPPRPVPRRCASPGASAASPEARPLPDGGRRHRRGRQPLHAEAPALPHRPQSGVIRSHMTVVVSADRPRGTARRAVRPRLPPRTRGGQRDHRHAARRRDAVHRRAVDAGEHHGRRHGAGRREQRQAGRPLVPALDARERLPSCEDVPINGEAFSTSVAGRRASRPRAPAGCSRCPTDADPDTPPSD